MNAEPQKEHEWLRQLVGEWATEAEAIMAPDEPPMKCKGVEIVRSLGGLWTIGEGRGEMPGGGEARTVMTLGYDPARERFVGTFVASMMTHLWLYDGSLDTTGKILTLDTEGPDFAGGDRPVKYKDVIEIRTPDHRVLTSSMLGEDGQWRRFMSADYWRQK